MQKTTLANGLEIIYIPQKSTSVTVQIMVKIGSAIEKPEELGLAHFLEHILFEGTPKRPNSFLIANEIEKVGGAFNAYTTHERTCYYAKVPKKHFKSTLNVLSDIIQHPLFQKESVEKEKKVVLKEIDMVHDDAHSLQWIELQKELYPNSKSLHPTYGTKKIVQNLTPKKIATFFKTYYHPKNITIAIVGEVKNWKKEVETVFETGHGIIKTTPPCSQVPLTKSSTRKISKDMSSCHIVLGFRAVKRSNPDSYVLDVIDAILGRGQSGKMFQQVRGEHGLAYEVGTSNVCDKEYGYFAVYAVVDPSKKEKTEQVIVEVLNTLNQVTKKELSEAKTYLEGEYLLDLEDTQKVADQILFWDQVESYTKADEYVKNIKQVTIQDITRVTAKYLQKYAKVVIEKKNKKKKAKKK